MCVSPAGSSKKNRRASFCAYKATKKTNLLPIDAGDLTESLLEEVKLQILTTDPKHVGCFLQWRTKGLVCVVNKGSSDVEISEFGYLCGFGPGAFKILKDDEAIPEGAVHYSLTGPDDTVLLANIGVTLKEVVDQAREKQPRAKLCYYDLKDAEDHSENDEGCVVP